MVFEKSIFLSLPRIEGEEEGNLPMVSGCGETKLVLNVYDKTMFSILSNGQYLHFPMVKNYFSFPC